ncbi:hypothetical protein BFC17_05045 [Alteromonas lipolytica]|uniref:Prepilin peptidase dependent protein B n=2 Tax=Alteromonas lipolytica TaxID=1856405 RepID=A0A1E8FB33_9ALTE|nr:hypothetical protein BFC17_05045 [Alteromonas lipolytica]
MVLAVGSLAAVSSLVGYGIGVNGNLINSARLNEELGNVYALLLSDLRRTGYSGATVPMVTDPDANPSPFNGSVVVSEFPGEQINSCILFSYDRNNNGGLDTLVPDERYGYRLRDGAVEIRRNGAACGDVGWEDLTDDDVIDVTALTFIVNQSVDNGITTTAISVRLNGELASNDSFSREYQTVVVVRNYDS